ncbi:hypothetical protein PN36_24680 [Candidatus Thiomargarita nelsonii]|uniref:ADP-ribosylglycohydrolase n=1 Tax=Candidatus Thiomargarita nelsonii TaxID=1003181 RepID=A0A0A6PJB2_9GAMM|nr:hypothetical protein PN36_24680 [Candidatus Thiomargarita nelsonii]
MKNKDRFLGCFIGLAVGDALGAPIEFCRRGRFKPISSMVEGGKFKLSLIRYNQTGNPYSGLINPKRPGNGCIMRLAPIPLFFFPDKEKIIHFSGESSKTTHGMPESIYASRLFGKMLFEALSGKDKESILFNNEPELDAPDNIKEIALGTYADKQENEIESTFFAGKCLEAALWCFLHSENYKDAVLKAVNLGGDADSTAAVCGQIAGAYYGVKDIPSLWIQSIVKSELILNMAERFLIDRIL